MNLDLTRRTLLHLAGASSFAAAASAAAQKAEGKAVGGGGPDLRQPHAAAGRHGDAAGAQADSVARDFYRDAIGLAVIDRTATSATLGAGGVKLARAGGAPRDAGTNPQAPPASITRRSCCRRARIWRAGWCMWR